MQFKLVALLTLVAASVNGAVLSKRSGEPRYTSSIVPSGPDTRFSDPCTCAGRAYTAVDTQAAINQGRTGGVFGR